MTYWEQRAIDSIGRMEAAVNETLPELVKSFEKAKRDLNDQIYRFYGRYAVNNKISLEEAKKILTFSELKDFRGNLKEYEKLAKDSVGTFNLEVSNLSTKARITRLQALYAQCDAILQRLYQEQKKQIESTAKETFNSEYYHSLFNIEDYTGFQFEFSKPATSFIQKIIEQPVYGADISTHLWRQDIDTGFKIRQTLNNMFVTGRPPQDFAEELQKAIGVIRVDTNGNVTGTGKKYEAYRLLYNESAHVVNQADLQAYKDDGLQEYEVIGTLDLHTCSVCQPYDGKHYPLNKAVEGVNYPSFHVNCRCTSAPYIPELADLSTTRMSRDPITGKSVETKAQTYEQWRKELDKKYDAEKMKTEQKKVENESSDFAQYRQYKSILKKDAPKSFAKFQDMKYNKPEKWQREKSFYVYKQKYPSAGIEHYDIYHELQTLGISKGIVLPPEKVSSYILEDTTAKDPTHIMKRMRERHITDDDVHGYVNNALVMFDQWKGARKAFYSSKGVTIVTRHGNDWIAKTAMSKFDFDEDAEKILEVVRKHVKRKS